MDIVERVARAMLAIVKPSWHSSPIRHVDIDDSDIDFEELARAAIEAMREPTDEMIRACDIDIPTEGMITGVWNDMIDAALKKA